MLRLDDLRFAGRVLWRDKGFALTAVLTLSVCLGANAALFNIVHSVILSPLPVPESDRIVLMHNSYPNAGVERSSNGVPDYYDRLTYLSDLFEEQALYNGAGLTVGEEGDPRRVSSMAVTPSFFRLLRVPAQLGRTFSEEEGQIGKEEKVVLSHALWQQLFGGRSEAVGQALRVNGRPFTVVGVMPQDFVFIDPGVRLWIPLAFTDEQKSDERRHSNNWENIGRLRAGVTIEQVRAQLDALVEANYERFPHFKEVLVNAGYNVQAHFLKDELVSDVRGTLYLLWGGVLVVLLIGAANIANLVLARSSVRVKELATRMAMGAGLGRISRLLFTEGLMLSIFSGAIGLGLGWLILRGSVGLGLDELPRGSEIAMGWVSIALVAGLSLLVALLVSVIPVIHAWRADLSLTVRQESRTGTASRGMRLARSGMVSAQVAFAFVLLLGAGLLLESFRKVLAVDPGFRQADTVLTGQVSLPGVRYEGSSALRRFAARALERLRALPAVQQAGLASTVPFAGSYSDSVILAEGYQMRPGESLVSPSDTIVSPGYFQAMGIPLLEGRTFDDSDRQDGPRSIVVDQRLAEKFWPGTSAVGKRLFFPEDPQDLTAVTDQTTFLNVVGVVGNVKLRALVDPDERVGAYYRPLEQNPRRRLNLVLKASGDPEALTASVRRTIAELDPELPFYDVFTMQQRVDSSLTTRRAPLLLALVFGSIALFLAAVGIYGVLAYVVTLRTREIGIRMALGSDQGGVFRLVLGQGALLLAIGLAAGLAGLLALSRFLKGLLYSVQPLSLPVIAAVSALLGFVALAACAFPALRAARIDPVRALNVM